MLKLENISSGYNKKPIIKNINLEIKKGTITSIIGPNGSGKSTLLKTIMGQTEITKGQILINNQDINNLKLKEKAKIISYMPQSYNITNLTVEKMVLHGRFAQMSYPRNYSKKDRQITQEMIDKMHLREIQTRPLSTLSGGQRQKVYLAMILCTKSQIILMDEPTTYLDIHHQMEILKIIKELKNQGKTIVTIFHDINQAIEISDTIITMKDGEIITKETPKQLLKTDTIEKIFKIQKTIAKDQDQNQYLVFKL